MVFNCLPIPFLVACLVLSVTSVCPNGWAKYDDDCFALFTENATWTDAKIYCNEFGGHLAQLTTQKKTKYARDFLQYINHENIAWVGGEDKNGNGTWSWTAHGDTFVDTQWAQGEPSDGRCLALTDQHDHKWVSSKCMQQAHFLCERRSTPMQ